MMTQRHVLIACCFALTAGSAQAHVGHLGEVASHDHWVAGAALGAALAATLWGVLKGKKEDAADQPEDTPDEEEEAA